jgi:hypothetical protein
MAMAQSHGSGSGGHDFVVVTKAEGVFDVVGGVDKPRKLCGRKDTPTVVQYYFRQEKCTKLASLRTKKS